MTLNNKEIFSKNLEYYMNRKGVDRNKLCSDLDLKYTTVRDWLKGITYPRIGKIELLANYFEINKSDLIEEKVETSTTSSDAQNATLEAINDKVIQLHPERQENVLGYATAQLDEQIEEERKKEKQKKPKIIIEEPVITYPRFKAFYHSAAKAGPEGFGYDDNHDDFVYVANEPPRHDLATLVDGDSMNPDYQDGDILYLRDYGTTSYSGELCVVIIDDSSYFKKVYSSKKGLRLVSLNPDKDRFPDKEITFPPSEDTHIKIFTVVGSDTPVDDLN